MSPTATQFTAAPFAPTLPIRQRVGRVVLVALALVMAWMLARPALVQAQAGLQRTILVQFRPDMPAEARAAAIAAMGGEEVAWLAQIRVAEVRVTLPVGVSTTDALAAVTAADGLLFAEEDQAVTAMSLPNDPAFMDAGSWYGLAKVEAPAAWDITVGSGDVVIAVVDSGVKLDHPAFSGRLTPGYDFVNQDARADDDAGHGTHVAGIIAAAMNDGQGMAGLCPACRLMPVKVLNAQSLGTWSQLAQGILYATDHGADIINLSLGATIPSQTLDAAVRYAQARDVIVVAAAGNHGSSAPFYPAALDGVVAVAATDARDAHWARSATGDHLDFAAPGDLIYSTYHDLNNVFGGYTYMSGTSMATPFVSALAGLVLSMAPDLTSDDVIAALRHGAEDLGAPGWDPQFGYGRINARATLHAPIAGLAEAVQQVFRPTMTEFVYLPGVMAR